VFEHDARLPGCRAGWAGFRGPWWFLLPGGRGGYNWSAGWEGLQAGDLGDVGPSFGKTEPEAAAAVAASGIKPANVLVTSGGQVKILDFGIARMAHSADLTQTGTLIGTAEYLSPEQAAGQSAGPQADLYAERQLKCRQPPPTNRTLDESRW